jgi:hypothetical protein
MTIGEKEKERKKKEIRKEKNKGYYGYFILFIYPKKLFYQTVPKTVLTVFRAKIEKS